METKTITHEVFLSASPNEVFEALMDAKQHREFTGAPAEIHRKAGGSFSLYGGSLNGKTVELTQDKNIVQDWRDEKWPKGHYSRVSYVLTPMNAGRGTQVSLVHAGVPAEYYETINNGWRESYWTKIAPYLRERKVAPVRRFLEEFKNHGNLDIVDDTWTDDCKLHVPGFATPPGRQGQKIVGKMIFDAFSNVHVDVEDTIVEGDRVVERHRAQAIHKGEFMGIPATGKKVHWTENHIYRMRDGMIAEAWSEVSFHDLFAQLSQKTAARA
jgi:predicted ester cyclase/uncharacterized protein YndB with AHSA1/START domain